MLNTDTYFSASVEIARRTGVISSRYRTVDGRFIITDKDMGPVRLTMTPEEYVYGLDVILITRQEAMRLIAENNYQTGERQVEPEPEPEPVVETSSNEEETPADENTGGESSEEQSSEESSSDEQSSEESSDEPVNEETESETTNEQEG